jgi:hypothetical protein
VSIERIKMKLAEKAPTEGDGLRLDFYVEVIGMAPRVDLFPPDFSWAGPAPWGGMTHGEFLGVVTPEEFKAPVIPLFPGILMNALTKVMSGRVREAKEELQIRDQVTRERLEVELQYIGGAGAPCPCHCEQPGCTCPVRGRLRGSTFTIRDRK